MLILLAHANAIRAIIRFANFHSGCWANQKTLLVGFCVLVILAIFTEHHLRNVGGGDVCDLAPSHNIVSAGSLDYI